MQDPFDYEAEDKLIAISQEARERAQAITTHKLEAIPHPYPHPRSLICNAIIVIVKRAAPAIPVDSQYNKARLGRPSDGNDLKFLDRFEMPAIVA